MKDTITDTQAEALIRKCQEEAQKSIDEGNPPFGCVITDMSGNILMRAHNTQNTDNDPTAHAEIKALSQLGRKRGSRYLDDCVIFANAESCSMCMSASIKAKITVFYYGAPAETKMNPWLTMQDVAAKATTPLELHGSILAEECAAQISGGRKRETTPDISSEEQANFNEVVKIMANTPPISNEGLVKHNKKD